ncbi:MAG: hypothetical protein AAFY80_11070, partial [Pseudomonadota bacterium]
MGKLPVVFSRTGAHSATPATNQSDLRTQAKTLARAFGRDEEGSFLIFSLFLFIGIRQTLDWPYPHRQDLPSISPHLH